MNTIKQTYVIAATPEEVWAALTDPEIIREWSGAAAEFPAEAGAAYSLWDGSIGGTVVEIVPTQRLVQTWQPVDWQRQDSVVRFTLLPEGGTTLVDLVHENVEESDYDGTSEGWDSYYLGAIKRLLEARALRTRQSAGPATTARKATTRKKSTTRKKTATRRKTAATQKTAPRKKAARRIKTTTAKSSKTARTRRTPQR